MAGVFDTLGGLAGGYAEARDNRIARNKANETNKLLAQIASKGGKPAEGLGGTNVDAAGKPMEQPKKSGGGIGGAIKKGVNNVLGFKAFKTGGRITKTGLAYVHKGETIIPAEQSVERKHLRKSVRKSRRSSSRR